jgi:hypothetical protein
MKIAGFFPDARQHVYIFYSPTLPIWVFFTTFAAAMSRPAFACRLRESTCFSDRAP